MTYTKSQLESLIQGLDKALNFFDEAYFGRMMAKPQWATDYRASLVEDLTTYRKALAEADEEAVSQANKFDLLLADEKRKAYDQGQVIGYAEGFDEGWRQGTRGLR